MGSITDVLGTGGGTSAGGHWNAQGTTIQEPLSTDQIRGSYNDALSGVRGQASFLQALQAQNGIGNQSAVYNQLQGVANGTGPNPAQAMLAQQTGANVANQAALMAGQRGAGANVGLMARQAAQQGASTQQQAVGQGATMQANQSMNALGQMGNLASTQVGQQGAATQGYTTAAENQESNLLGYNASINNANIQMQSNMNNTNSQIAGINAQGQQAMLGGMMQGLGSGGGMMSSMLAKGGVVKGYDDGGEVESDAPKDSSAPGPSQADIDANAASARQFDPNPMGPNQGVGANSAPPPPTPISSAVGPGSWAGQYLQNNNQQIATAPSSAGVGSDAGAAELAKGMASMTSGGQSGKSSGGGGGGGGGMGSMMGMLAMLSKGGKVPALLSPGEIYISPDKLDNIKNAKDKGKKAFQQGERIPGQPKVKGDSEKNDIVPKTLETGGIVVKRTAAQNPDKTEAFINAVLNKKRRK